MKFDDLRDLEMGGNKSKLPPIGWISPVKTLPSRKERSQECCKDALILHP